MPRPSRPLTTGEIALARTVFGDAIAYDRVRVNHHKWIFFQPRHIVMAPMGSLHFNPHGDLYCDDFGAASQRLKGLFIHEMTHVWQAQTRGRGLGRRALPLIEQLAREHGARALHLMVRPENLAAVQLYRGAGYSSPPRTFLTKDLVASKH